MKEKFSGYYMPSKPEFDRLWKEGVFAFDASSLLNLYGYSEKTRNEILNLLAQFKPRLWLPYQVASEYHRNRLNVIRGHAQMYREIKDEVDPKNWAP